MTTDASTLLTVPVSGRDHVRGADGAVVTLAEKGDTRVRIGMQARAFVKGFRQPSEIDCAICSVTSRCLPYIASPILQSKRQKQPALSPKVVGDCTNFFMTASPRFPKHGLQYRIS